MSAAGYVFHGFRTGSLLAATEIQYVCIYHIKSTCLMHHILDDFESLTAVYQINFDLLPLLMLLPQALSPSAVSGKQDCGNVRIMSLITAELKAATVRPRVTAKKVCKRYPGAKTAQKACIHGNRPGVRLP